MPDNSHRIYGSYRVRFSKVVKAPAKYAYSWFTDFREDDGKLSAAKPRYRVMRLAKNRVLRVRFSKGKGRVPPIAVDLVRLSPPSAWHVDQIDEADLATVDYKVARLGPRRCRVTLDITERWMISKFPSKREYARDTSAYWDRLVAAAEKRYLSGKPAAG